MLAGSAMRLLLLAGVFGALIYGAEDITIALEDGSIVIRPQFIRVNDYGSYVPELSFRIRNQTRYPWRTIKLQFEVGGLCNGEPRQWSIPAVTSLGWKDTGPISKDYKDIVISLVGKVDGCRTEIIKASLLLAENDKLHIDGVTGERVDLEKQLQEVNAKRDAEAAETAAEERAANEEQAKQDAADAEQRKRQAAERRKKEVESEARYAKSKAEAEARASEERARVRAACAAIYRSTADKKVGDLTVKEEQQVRACQALGLYPPAVARK